MLNALALEFILHLDEDLKSFLFDLLQEEDEEEDFCLVSPFIRIYIRICVRAVISVCSCLVTPCSLALHSSPAAHPASYGKHYSFVDCCSACYASLRLTCCTYTIRAWAHRRGQLFFQVKGLWPCRHHFISLIFCVPSFRAVYAHVHSRAVLAL